MKRWFKLCSFLLVLAMTIQMLPTAVWSEESTKDTGSNGMVSSSPAVQTEKTAANVLYEIAEDRTEYSKSFRLSNGTTVAAVYADPVHYEKDGTWQDIDNTLKTTTDGKFTNTAGAWSVALPQSISKTAPVTVTRNGYSLSFTMSGELRSQGNLDVAAVGQAAETATVTVDGKAQTFQVSNAQTVSGQVQTIDSAAAKAAAQYPEVVLDKSASALMYSGVYANTQLRYDLHGSTLKESVILQSYNSTLRGYRYTLNTGGLLPVINDDGSILFLNSSKEIQFFMPAPYLIDDAQNCSYDVQVSLTGKDGIYTLSYLLPSAWLADSARAWPVVLDPAVTTEPEIMNIRDHTVASNGSYSYERPVLECGYGNSNHVQRIFLKYRVLPPLTSADVILNAQVALYKIQNSDSIVSVDVHKVLGPWESEALTWANKPDYDTTIEDYALIDALGYYYWNVTDIVRGWYSGQNTGMMFKASDQYEDGSAATWKQFASSDNGNSAWMPCLEITFRNNNGIEAYWDYTSASAGRAGTGSVNSYTGNLTWVRSDMGFGGNRMPVSISHVYSLNDSANNKFGMGYGWRTNYNQLVYTWTYNGTTYYVWEDSDGTSHYFNRQSNGTYKDEDGLELTLTVSGNTKTITDKNGNKSYFDENGRLYKLENNQATKSSINITYSGGKISLVTDGAGRKYTFTYTDGLLTKIEYQGSGNTALSSTVFSYTDGNLTAVTDQDQKASTYTYTGHILTSAADIDGYKLQYTYNEPADYQPYRVLSVEEFDGTTAGGKLTMEYEHNQTTFTDALGNKQILQFNNRGNVTAIMDDEGHAQYAQYATDTEGASGKSNQLTKSSRLQNTVSNLIYSGNVEHGGRWYSNSNANLSVTRSTDTAYSGSQSLKMVNSSTGNYAAMWSSHLVQPGETFTYSGYIKTANAAGMLALYDSATGTTYPGPDFSAGQDWQRLQTTYTNTTTEDQQITCCIFVNGTGTVYADCLQFEQAQTASRFNLLENGDFRYVSHWSSYSGRVTETAATPTLDPTVYKMTGNPRATNRIYQTVLVKGDQNDTFVLGGWAKGNSAHIYEEEHLPTGQNLRVYALYGTFNYTDGTTSDPFMAHFNPNTDQWQYSAQVMVAEKAYASVKVELVYDYNVNTVFFDGIQLYKEEFGNSYTYDEDGNVTSVVDLQKQTTTYEYANNNLTKETLPTGAELTYEYDSYHNVTKATSAEGQIYEFTYDTWGNNTSVSIVNGESKLTSTATYSEDGNRLVKTTDALGKSTFYDYDVNTNTLNWVRYPEDTDATRTTYTYDEMYRVASAAATTDTNLALSASYTYTDDLLTAIATPTTTYSFEYGDFALRTKVKAGNRTLATYSYTDVTNYLDELVYGNGNRVEYEYDSKGRLLTQTYEDGTAVAYTYDNNGALATVTGGGIKTTYYYDFTDRMVRYVESGTGYSHTVGYEYDNINNLTTQVETINGVDRSTSYTYDDDNRVTSKQTGNTKVAYTYDGFGRISQQVTTSGSTTVLTETFTYNGNSSQIATYATTAGGVTKTYTYTYDDNGNILTIHDGSNTITYTYDSANQLVRENNQEKGYTHTWTYDNAGNIQERKEYAYTIDSLENLIATATVNYTYGDENWGDLLTGYNGSTVTYDEIGNPLDDGTWTYAWQHSRQLASMAKKDGTATWDYAYNPDDLRTQRTDGTTTYTYVYNGSQLTAMTVGSNTLYFSYDAAGAPVSVKYGNNEYYYTSNIQGDVTGIVNAEGETVVTYTYDAWGNILSCTGSEANTLGALNPLRYRGYVYDEETGLYYLQSRYYNPALGRFINADNYPATGQGFVGNNMYAYCNNNPIIFIDKTGQASYLLDLLELLKRLFSYEDPD